jgi:hypothetical protein
VLGQPALGGAAVATPGGCVNGDVHIKYELLDEFPAFWLQNSKSTQELPDRESE